MSMRFSWNFLSHICWWTLYNSLSAVNGKKCRIEIMYECIAGKDDKVELIAKIIWSRLLPHYILKSRLSEQPTISVGNHTIIIMSLRLNLTQSYEYFVSMRWEHVLWNGTLFFFVARILFVKNLDTRLNVRAAIHSNDLILFWSF